MMYQVMHQQYVPTDTPTDASNDANTDAMQLLLSYTSASERIAWVLVCGEAAGIDHFIQIGLVEMWLLNAEIDFEEFSVVEVWKRQCSITWSI